jgi:hypothetical protein
VAELLKSGMHDIMIEICMMNLILFFLSTYSLHVSQLSAGLNISASSVYSNNSTSVSYQEWCCLVGMPGFRFLLCCGSWDKPRVHG